MRAPEADRGDRLAAAAGTNPGDFVPCNAPEATSVDMVDRHVVMIPTEHWENLERWVHAPAMPSAALQELAATRPVWQD